MSGDVPTWRAVVSGDGMVSAHSSNDLWEEARVHMIIPSPSPPVRGCVGLDPASPDWPGALAGFGPALRGRGRTRRTGNA
jgi:hypothetical protein